MALTERVSARQKHGALSCPRRAGQAQALGRLALVGWRRRWEQGRRQETHSRCRGAVWAAPPTVPPTTLGLS